MADHHALELTNRGGRLRWLPSCQCGWVGIAAKRRAGAERLYHQHVTTAARRRPPQPRAVTPADRLPAAWR